MRSFEVWKTLSEDDQRRIGAYIAGMRQNNGIGQTLVSFVAQRVNRNERTISFVTVKQFSEFFRKATAGIDADDFLSGLLVAFYTGSRTKLLHECYDLLGVKRDRLTEQNAPSFSSQRGADLARELIQRFGKGETQLFLSVMNENCFENWKPMVAAALKDSLALDAEDAEEATTNSVAVANTPISSDEVEDETPSPAPFTLLEDLLIQQILNSINGIEGGHSLEELEELVQEFVKLAGAARRNKGHYHRGFLDALLNRKMAMRGRAPNPAQRAWYLCGFFEGELHTQSTDAVIEQIVQLNSKDNRALHRRCPEAGARLAEKIVMPLLEKHEYERARLWINVLMPYISNAVAQEVVRWSSRALRNDDATDVKGILELMLSGLKKHKNASLMTQSTRLLRRRLAVALRQMGRFLKAEEMIDELLTEEHSPDDRAYLLGEKVLLSLGMKLIEDLRLPRKEGSTEAAEPDPKVQEAIRLALEHEVAVPIALVATSLPTVANPQASDSDLASTSDRLLSAITTMADNTTFWNAAKLLPRARAYHAMIELRSGTQSPSRSSVSRLQTAISEGVRLPLSLLEEAITNALLHNVEGSGALANTALRVEGIAILKKLDVRAAAERSPEFRKQAIEFLEDGLSGFNEKDQFRIASRLLDATKHHGVNDPDLAMQALDAIEGLADKSSAIADQFIELLQDSENWSHAWDQDERDSRFIALTRDSGRIEECQATVRDQCRQTIQGLCKETTRRRFYRDVTNDPFHAQDLIEELRLLGAEPEEVENLKTFLANQSQKPATPTIAAIPPLTIFWVGGDETQEDYDEYIKAKIQDAYPSVTLEIHHTGWTSNWGRKLDDFHDRFIQSNALVLMTMIRTNLARTLRCLAGNHDIPWISCTGRGRSSSLRAIEEAINVATRQHERGGGQSECEATQ